MTSINPRAGLTVAGKTRTATQLSHTKFNAFHYVSSAAFVGTQTNNPKGQHQLPRISYYGNFGIST